MSGLSSVLIALFSSATKHRFLSGVPVEDELSGSHGICFYLQLLLHTGLEPCHISRLGEHTVSQCPPQLQMACLCAAALIGTLYLFFPSCKCFLASSGLPFMNIHTEHSPRACRLINIQEAPIDYHVFADVFFTECLLVGSMSLILSDYVIQLILSYSGNTHPGWTWSPNDWIITVLQTKWWVHRQEWRKVKKEKMHIPLYCK